MNGIATVSLSGTLEDKLRAAADAGFEGVEIFDADFVSSMLSAVEVRTLLDSLGLRCLLYQPLRDFEGLPEPHRSRAFARARQKFQVMRILGCDRLLVCSNCSSSASGDRDCIVADLRELGELAAEHGILIGYEALAWGRHVNDHRQVWEIVQAVDHPNVGILLDSFHSLSRDIPNTSIREIDPAKIIFVQLADAPVIDMDHLYWSRHFRNLPGQGGLDLTGYVAELLRLGYDGPFSLEIFNDRFRSTLAKMVARDGMRSLVALRDSAQRKIGLAADMPSPATIDRVEFVEFAVDEEHRTALEAMIGSAGFARIGFHRTKPVELWRNGTACFVLNYDATGFVATHRLSHGTSICAIGLVVEDGPAAMARARALGIAEDASGLPGMSALRGMGGSLVYILDAEAARTIWQEQFELQQATVSTDQKVGVCAIDHLAATVSMDEYLSWQLYWRSMFDVYLQAPQDIIDPNGLVQSQAIQNRSGSFRITLNGTDARDALSARFLNQSFGAGYQHIAFRVGNLTTAAGVLDRLRLQRLQIPANYHDDVAARLDLPEEEMAVARRYDMMIDEDHAGHRYRQLYSRAFNKTFFFEFVERGQYQGYGASNAATRLTSQNRYRPRREGSVRAASATPGT